MGLRARDHEAEMVFVAAARVPDAVRVPRPVGRQLLRAQLDPVRAQQVPSRAGRVRRRPVASVAGGVPSRVGRPAGQTGVHSPGETRESVGYRSVFPMVIAFFVRVRPRFTTFRFVFFFFYNYCVLFFFLST